MTGRQPTDDTDSYADPPAPQVVLAVADPGGGSAAPLPLPDGGILHFAEFVTLDAAALCRIAPDTVVSPLASPGFDCFDLAALLVAAGFTGRYRVGAENLPNPDLVRREMAQAFPTLDFDLLSDSTVAAVLNGSP